VSERATVLAFAKLSDLVSARLSRRVFL